MGFLSKSAASAFTKGQRRAHVPDWFEPASYVFGCVAAIVLVLMVLTSDDPVRREVAPANTNPTTNSSAPVGSIPAAGDMRQMALVNGSVVMASNAAYEMGFFATEALFTGDFALVTIYPGQTTPLLANIWPEPAITEIIGIETFPDGSYRFTFMVDPDGVNTELARPVGVLIVPVPNGWAYLPG